MFILCVLLLCFVVYIHCWWYLVMVGGFRKKLQSSFCQLRWFDRIRCWWSCNWQHCQKGMFLSCNPWKKGGLAFPLVSYSTISGFVWKCWVNIPNEIAIFIGIMISKTVGYNGVHNIFKQTPLAALAVILGPFTAPRKTSLWGSTPQEVHELAQEATRSRVAAIVLGRRTWLWCAGHGW